MRFLSFVLLSLSLFFFACGGNRTDTSGSVLVSDITLAENAVSSSPWSSEPVIDASTSQKTAANINIQEVLTTVVSEDEDSEKKSRTRTISINKIVTGSKGGTAAITGTRVITTTPPNIFPKTIETEGTVEFDGYDSNEFSIHGTSQYSGTKTITSIGNFTRNFTSHGGYSYKSSEGVVSFTTQMDVSITCVDGVRTGTFTFTVNGETVTGVLPVRTIDIVSELNTENFASSVDSITTNSLTASQKSNYVSEIQSLITSVISEEDSNNKKERTRTVTINRDAVGPRGGSASVTGTRIVTTTPDQIYPITTATEATINFNSYKNADFTLLGETQYSGNTTITSARNFQTIFTTQGTFSYTNENGTFSFTTQMDVTLNGADGVYFGTYKYVIDGQTISGSF